MIHAVFFVDTTTIRFTGEDYRECFITLQNTCTINFTVIIIRKCIYLSSWQIYDHRVFDIKEVRTLRALYRIEANTAYNRKSFTPTTFVIGNGFYGDSSVIFVKFLILASCYNCRHDYKHYKHKESRTYIFHHYCCYSPNLYPTVIPKRVKSGKFFHLL